MKQKIWVKKTGSFSEAQDNDLQYYMNMSPQERIETVQFLREQYFKFNGMNLHEGGKGLRRTVKVVQKRKYIPNLSRDRADLEILLEVKKKNDKD
jgi:hypothetical protein